MTNQANIERNRHVCTPCIHGSWDADGTWRCLICNLPPTHADLGINRDATADRATGGVIPESATYRGREMVYDPVIERWCRVGVQPPAAEHPNPGRTETEMAEFERSNSRFRDPSE